MVSFLRAKRGNFIFTRAKKLVKALKINKLFGLTGKRINSTHSQQNTSVSQRRTLWVPGLIFGMKSPGTLRVPMVKYDPRGPTLWGTLFTGGTLFLGFFCCNFGVFWGIKLKFEYENPLLASELLILVRGRWGRNLFFDLNHRFSALSYSLGSKYTFSLLQWPLEVEILTIFVTLGQRVPISVWFF